MLYRDMFVSKTILPHVKEMFSLPASVSFKDLSHPFKLKQADESVVPQLFAVFTLLQVYHNTLSSFAEPRI